MGELRLTCEVSNSVNGGGKGACRAAGAGGADPADAGQKHLRIDALVDTGSVEVLLPRDIVRMIGLTVFGKKRVTLADDRKITLPVAGPLWLTAFNRKMVTDCLVGPAGCEPLIGQIVMESLDLILDPKKRIIRPRLTSGPVLKLKFIFSS